MAEKSEGSNNSARMFTLLILAIVIASLYLAKEILLPIALAVLLSFVLAPLVTRLERLRMGRVPSVVVVVVLAFSLIGGVGWVATGQIIELGNRLPKYKDNLITKIRSVRSGTGGKLEEAKEALADIGAELTDGKGAEASEAEAKYANSWLPWLSRETEKKQDSEAKAVPVKVVALPPSPLNQIQTWLGPLVAPLSTAGIVIVLVVFMLVKREDMRHRMIQLIGTSKLYATTEAIEDATSRLSRYLRMQLLINTIYGVVLAVGLSVIDVPNAVLWGVLGMLLRFLPYVGPWIAAAMPITLSLAVSEGWSQPLTTIALFAVLELTVNNVLEPWLYGSSIGVSSLGIILAAIFWTWLWGPIGLVLAMPLTVCLVVLGKYVPQLSFLSVLLGDRSALAPHEQLYHRLLIADDVEADKWTDDYLKSASWMEFYDVVLIPALHLAEQDRHAGLLSEQQESIVIESARELIDDLGERHAQREVQSDDASHVDAAEEEPMARVLCVPVRDRADETAAMMLGQSLSSQGFAVHVGSLDLLVSETIERIESSCCNVVVLTVLPPLGSRNGRYLCKRLRQQNPDLQIVVALFNGANLTKTQQSLRESGADVIVTNLTDAIAAVRQSAIRIRHADPEPQPAMES